MDELMWTSNPTGKKDNGYDFLEKLASGEYRYWCSWFAKWFDPVGNHAARNLPQDIRRKIADDLGLSGDKRIDFVEKGKA